MAASSVDCATRCSRILGHLDIGGNGSQIVAHFGKRRGHDRLHRVLPDLLDEPDALGPRLQLVDGVVQVIDLAVAP
jgi:hypothetical protein